jgi:hypothetical protein
MKLIRFCLGMLALSCIGGSTALGGTVLSDNFNATGKVPAGWTPILGGSTSNITEKPQNLTLTDTSGHGTGIASTTAAINFKTVGSATIEPVINSINSNGNAVFGLLGLTAKGALMGILAAGIDAKGNVFIVEADPTIPEKVVMTNKVVPNYTGGSIALTFAINASGVDVKGPKNFDTGPISFKSLSNFSLASAFGTAAIPALDGASNSGTGGVASFKSITVITGAGSAIIPEPASLHILAIGLASLGGLGALRRRMRVSE